MMQQSVEDGGREDLVVEDLAPVGKPLVAGHHQTAALVAADEQAEEETGFLPRQRQAAQFVQHDELRIGRLLERPLEPILVAGPDQAGHQRLEGEEEDGVPGFHGFHAERDRQVRLADAWWPEQDRIVRPLAARFVARLVRLRHGRGDRWVLFQRSLADDTRKYYVLNLDATASLKQLVRLACSRWPIKQQYRELRDELGLDHFEGRTYPGWAHHAVLNAAAFTFCSGNGVDRRTRRVRP